MSPVGPNRRCGPRRALAALAALACLPAAPSVASLRAQPVPRPVAARIAMPTPDTVATAAPAAGPFDGFQPATAETRPRHAPLWAAAASAVVPGAGQALLRQPHAIVYGALEAYMWLEALDARRFSNRQRDEYRDVARTIARRNAPGTKPDGDWDYYERLEKLCTHTLPFNTRCLSSGQYDVVTGGDIDPETDPATYNGQIWAQALRKFMRPGVVPVRGTVEYQRALAEYAEKAEKPEFFWSWIGQQQQQDVYRQAIGKANDKWHEYLRDRYVIIANHVLSSVDAFITVRVRRYGRPGDARQRSTGFEATVPWAPFGRPRRSS